jgi:hypothetical protein
MTRVGSQLTFCSPELILKNTVVEQDVQNKVVRLFGLNDNSVESANTLFFDGILSSEIVSLKQILKAEIPENEFKSYNYIDISGDLKPKEILSYDKPLILDFGTTSISEINLFINTHNSILNKFSIFEIIAACTFYPLLALGLPAQLTENRITKLVLWENVDLINKLFTAETRIKNVN